MNRKQIAENDKNPIVVEHWAKSKLPGFDCVVYSDGTVTVLDCYSLEDSGTRERTLFCNPLCDTTIESVEKYGAAHWVAVDKWTRIDYGGGAVIAGDGAMGNEGFIARVNGDGSLVWAIFFTNSNPIKELIVNGNALTAINEH